MRSFPRNLSIAVGAFIMIQFVPVARENPPTTTEVPSAPAVRAILERACYDCHSNATKWPWYAFVAPVSWLVSYDVAEGREHVNFQRWEGSSRDRLHRIHEVWEVIEEDEMPLPIYRPLHPEATLSEEDVALLRGWTRAVESQIEAESGAGEG